MFRTILVEEDAENRQTEVFLPLVPVAGAHVGWGPNKVVRVEHTILKAAARVDRLDAPVLIVRSAPGAQATVHVVPGGTPTPPTRERLNTSDPRWRGIYYVTRTPVVGDGIDIKVRIGADPDFTDLGHKVLRADGTECVLVEGVLNA